MEEFSANCGFILTCNFLNRIIEPLHSRCSVIYFKIDTKDKPKLASQFMKRVITILQTENVEFEEKVVAELIMKFFPDWRRVLNELQRFSAMGKIDSNILASVSDESIKTLIGTIKDKDFKAMRKWVSDNIDNEPSIIFRKIYDGCFDIFESSSVPELIILLGEYQYKSAFVVDQEINFVAFLTEIMASCQIKK
jgi:DNA polymerase III delta prime subunit